MLVSPLLLLPGEVAGGHHAFPELAGDVVSYGIAVETCSRNNGRGIHLLQHRNIDYREHGFLADEQCQLRSVDGHAALIAEGPVDGIDDPGTLIGKGIALALLAVETVTRECIAQCINDRILRLHIGMGNDVEGPYRILLLVGIAVSVGDIPVGCFAHRRRSDFQFLTVRVLHDTMRSAQGYNLITDLYRTVIRELTVLGTGEEPASVIGLEG